MPVLPRPLPRGSTLGILGGGQLGRMLAMAAAQLGYRVHVFAPEADSVAAEVAACFTCASYADTGALLAFGAACDAVTWEFENVPVAPLAAIADKLACPPRALEVAQDRLAEKRFVAGLGGTPAPFLAVDSPEDLKAGIASLGGTIILKTRREGYDGKGQWRIASPDQVPADAWQQPLVAEGLVAFEAEFSVILVRGQDGESRVWDSTANEHREGMLHRSALPPPPLVAEQIPEARALTARVAEALGYVGVLTAEFFATAEGPVFNEMAPRVHNSGHWTIEGAVTSQFANHIRAVAGLPLGETRTVAGRIEMRNLVGEAVLDAAPEALALPDTHLHDYGKTDLRPGRKTGHITRLWR